LVVVDWTSSFAPMPAGTRMIAPHSQAAMTQNTTFFTHDPPTQFDVATIAFLPNPVHSTG
jgi:hypothetical protein